MRNDSDSRENTGEQTPAASAGVTRPGGWLRNISITSKLAVMVASLAAVGVALLLIITFALNLATGVRAYVGGEGLYSKGQKDAVYYLTRYARSRNEQDYRRFQAAIAIPLGDHLARVEMQKPEFDYDVAARGFIQGGNDPDDVQYLIGMFRQFHGVSYFAKAIGLWTSADVLIAELARSGRDLHAEINAGEASDERIAAILDRIEQINLTVTPIEYDFSATLGEAARWIKRILLGIIYVAGAALLSGGLWLSFKIVRGLRVGILNLRNAALRASQGDLDHAVAVLSGDELGDLAKTFNQMIEHRRGAEDALRGTTEFLQKVMQSANDAIYALDLEGRFTLANQRTCDITGYDISEVLGTCYDVLYDPEHIGRVRPQVDAVMNGTSTVSNFETPLRRKDGRLVTITFSLAPLIKDGKIVGAVGTGEDITERRKAESELAARGEELVRLNRIHAMHSSVSAMIVRVHDRKELLQEACRIAVEYGGFLTAFVGELLAGTQDGRAIAWAGIDDGYAALIRVTTRDDSAFRMRPGNRALRNSVRAVCNDLAADEGFADVRADALARGFRSGAAFPLVVDGTADAVLVLFAGEVGFFNVEEVKLLEELVGDISLTLGAITKESRLQFLASFDPLTELANRNLFKDRIGQKMLTANREKSELALVVLEIERFDALSHSLGQGATDKVIAEMARRLRASLGEQVNIARVTHKAFAAMMVQKSDAAPAVVDWIEQQLFGVFDTPFSIGDQDLRFAGRAGVAMFPADGAEAEELLHNAESALERARESSERVFFYAPAMNLRLAQRLTMETKLRRAIEREEFVVYYQPKLDMSDDTICGVEALMRWNDPDSGLVPPAQFIPFMEETGLILDVSRWLLRKVAEDLRGPLVLSGGPPRTAVNISPMHLQHKDFLADVLLAIHRGGKFGDHLDIEITESMLMQDIEISIEKLQLVRAAGLDIAIDDFGTGYSSLAYLSRLPATAVKIDQNFIARMQTDGHVMNLVSTIISLAHSLKLKVIAEGVETQAQLQTLRRLRCDQYQGFVYSPAVPIDRLVVMLREHIPAAHRA